MSQLLVITLLIFGVILSHHACMASSDNSRLIPELSQDVPQRIVSAFRYQVYQLSKAKSKDSPRNKELRQRLERLTQSLVGRVPLVDTGEPRPFPPPHIFIPKIAKENEDVYVMFINGSLIYKKGQPDEVRLPIADVKSFQKGKAYPLDGVFDLSRCGDADKYVSVNTGYRKGKKKYRDLGGYKFRFEIWLAPRFLIERELNTSAGHLQSVMESWGSPSAPIGIFWTWSDANLDEYAYLTHKTPSDLSSVNCYKNYTHIPHKLNSQSHIFILSDPFTKHHTEHQKITLCF